MQRRAERREQLKDDPYYIIDDPPPKPTEEDVEAIPVVRLENMPSLLPGMSNVMFSTKLLMHKADTASRRPFLRATTQEFSPSNTFIVEREGEMPENAVPRETTVTTSSGRGTPLQGGSLPNSAHLSSFPLYETTDDLRTSTPEPIKVVRPKKKTAGGEKEKKKKKRPTNASAPPDT